MAVVDSLGSSRVSLSGNSVNLITQGTEETNKMQMVIAPEDATLNNKSIEQRYLDLTGDSGTLDADQYKLVTTYDDLIIRIAGISYRQVGKPQNGTGNYVFTNTYYAQPNGTEEFVAYIVTIKTDKTWTSTIKNFLQIGEQTYEQTEADSAVIIRNGNIVKQMATFTVTGNTEKIWSFPYSYDTGKKPIVWVNSVAEGNSASNGAAVISWSETSMTVRSCGVDSQITFYAEGWISK